MQRNTIIHWLFILTALYLTVILTSNLNLVIPLSKFSNNIVLRGSIGYIDSLNPDIKLYGNIPYWFDSRCINIRDFY